MGWGWCLDNTIVPAMRVAFSIKRSLFLEVTPGEIQQEGEKPLRRRKAWAFGRSSTQNFMQLAGEQGPPGPIVLRRERHQDGTLLARVGGPSREVRNVVVQRSLEGRIDHDHQISEPFQESSNWTEIHVPDDRYVLGQRSADPLDQGVLHDSSPEAVADGDQTSEFSCLVELLLEVPDPDEKFSEIGPACLVTGCLPVPEGQVIQKPWQRATAPSDIDAQDTQVAWLAEA